MAAMRVAEIIRRKRFGEELSREEIEAVVMGYVRGDVPDYQVSAWLMAVCCRGMSKREVIDLTSVIVASGSILDLRGASLPVVDKHSSGGVGDKTTLVVAPLVRACGAAVAKMSGRGLGFTGGTLDKLESIPGFRVGLSKEQFVTQVEREGIAVAGQTPELVPADRRLYALRDVTGTVESIPLIASSIMSKKLAVGAQGLVLDVKVGRGAFMKDLDEARELAGLMMEIGEASGRRVTALLTPMDEPLGRAVGNALEVAEALETLRGDGPRDLADLSLLLAGEMLYLAGRAASTFEGREMAQRAMASGQGLEWMERLIALQGGDPRVVESPGLLGRAPVVAPLPAPRSGSVTALDAWWVAQAVLTLGAGRATKEDRIDPLVGVRLLAKQGDTVEKGEPLAEVHARDDARTKRAMAELLHAFEIGEEPGPVAPPLMERLGA